MNAKVVALCLALGLLLDGCNGPKKKDGQSGKTVVAICITGCISRQNPITVERNQDILVGATDYAYKLQPTDPNDDGRPIDEITVQPDGKGYWLKIRDNARRESHFYKITRIDGECGKPPITEPTMIVN